MSDGRKTQQAIPGFEDRRKPQAKESRQLPEAGKDKKINVFFPRASEMNVTLLTPWF